MGIKQTSKNVTFSKPFADADRSGYIWVAPLGTAVPTDAISALGAEFVGLGYVSEDGLVEPAAFEEADGIIAAGGEVVAKGDPTFNKTWTGTAIEALNTDLLKVIYGTAQVTVDAETGDIEIDEKGISPEHHVIVIDELLANGRPQRSIMADAQFIVTGDVPHVHTELVSYEFTINAYPTADMPAQKRYIKGAPKA